MIDIEKYRKEIAAVDWDKYNGSIYYNPDKVASALTSLALVQEESSEGIYTIEGTEPPVLLLNAKIENDLLYTVGNNHSGSYYPVVQKALPFIIQIALNGNHEVARNCAINALIELYYFSPENDSTELSRFVKETIEKTIRENKENFTKFSDDYSRNKSVIADLFEILYAPEYLFELSLNETNKKVMSAKETSFTAIKGILSGTDIDLEKEREERILSE